MTILVGWSVDRKNVSRPRTHRGIVALIAIHAFCGAGLEWSPNDHRFSVGAHGNGAAEGVKGFGVGALHVGNLFPSGSRAPEKVNGAGAVSGIVHLVAIDSFGLAVLIRCSADNGV